MAKSVRSTVSGSGVTVVFGDLWSSVLAIETTSAKGIRETTADVGVLCLPRRDTARFRRGVTREPSRRYDGLA